MTSRWTPNVTVAAIVEQDGRYLLVEEQTRDGLKLNNPAGHLEPGESPFDAVIREALEETGRVFKPTHVVGVYLSRFQRSFTLEDVTYVRFAFTGTVSDSQTGWLLDEGIVRAIWMTPEEIRQSVDRHRSPLVLKCLEDHLAGKRYPLDLIDTHETVYRPEVK